MSKIIPISDTQYKNETGERYPWFTLPCLEWLITVDLTDKNILEYGSGESTLWFSKRAKKVVSIETNPQWLNKDSLYFDVRNEINGSKGYVSFADNSFNDIIPYYDIVIIDGIFRDECCKKAIELLSKNGGIIIADNWQQVTVWQSEYAETLMKPYKATLFRERGRNQEWVTAVFEIPKMA